MARKRRRGLSGLGNQFSQDIGAVRWFRSSEVYARVTYVGTTGGNRGPRDVDPEFLFKVDVIWLDDQSWEPESYHMEGSFSVSRALGFEEAAKKAALDYVKKLVLEEKRISRDMTFIGASQGLRLAVPQITRLDRAPHWVKGLKIPPPWRGLPNPNQQVDGLGGFGRDAGISVGVAALFVGLGYLITRRR